VQDINKQLSLLLDYPVFLQIGFDIGPVQGQMDQRHDNEHQGRPFVNVPKKMPEKNRNPAFTATSPWNKQPVYQARKCQNREQYERYDINEPELC
jgi:hypothetical protein